MGLVTARIAVFSGDVTNNHAEYSGVIACLQHANIDPGQSDVFRVDSMIVARQLQGRWACHFPALIGLYSQAL